MSQLNAVILHSCFHHKPVNSCKFFETLTELFYINAVTRQHEVLRNDEVLRKSMNKKWSSDKVKEAQRWIIKRWPESFTQGPDLRPLSLQIHKELLKYRSENPQLSSRVVREVLKRHTNSYGYLYGLVKHSKRYDLEGKPVSDVTPEHREWARTTLKHKQKEAQRIRKEARKKQNVQLNEQRKKAASRSVAKRTATDSNSASPVIRYKQARRKIVKPATERAVDLAS